MYKLPKDNSINKIITLLIKLSLILAPMDAWLMLPTKDLIVKSSIPRIVALISLITFLLLRNKIYKFPHVSGLWLLALWTAWYLASVLWATVNFVDVLILRKIMSLIFCNILILFSFLMEEREKMQNVFIIIIIISIMSALIEQFFGIRPYAERQHAFIIELTGFYINPSHLGATIALLSPWIVISRSMNIYLKFFLWLLSLFVIIRTASKGAIIGFLIINIILALNIKKLYFNTFLFYIGSGIVIFYAALKEGIIPNLLLEKIDMSFASALAHESYEGRVLIYKEMINLIYERPFIGYGIGSTSYYLWKSSHNLFLELWLEGGILCLLLFLLLYLILLFKLWRKKEIQNKLYFASLLGFLPISITVGNVFSLWIFWAVLGGSIYTAYKK